MKLRRMTRDDLLQVLKWRNRPEVRAAMYSHHIITPEEHFKWYAQIEKSDKDQYFIFENNNNKHGVVYFNQIDNISKTAFWGFYTGNKAPKGSGYRMEFLALQHAFEKLNLHKLNCEVLAFNKLVIEMHKKVGFKVEGLFRQMHFDGKNYQDVIRLGMLEDEWENAQRFLLNKIDL
jgi:UDP-4-amino-4,6-dideoxy-N-acetyl-beta-L-altrosamine N-acetyltransferase